MTNSKFYLIKKKHI